MGRLKKESDKAKAARAARSICSGVKPLPLAKSSKGGNNGGGKPKEGSGSVVKSPGGGQSGGGTPSGGGKPKEEKKPAANFFAEGTVKWCMETHGKFDATADDNRAFIEKCQGEGKAGVKAFACRWLARFFKTHATVDTMEILPYFPAVSGATGT